MTGPVVKKCRPGMVRCLGPGVNEAAALVHRRRPEHTGCLRFGETSMQVIRRHLLWVIVAVVGAFALGTVALSRGETINALWVVVAAICVYLIAYRYYSLFIANTVLGVDPKRKTPAHRHNDGLDYVPTDRNVLFGHHFAAIAGAGPLVGPVLAAQMGYLPGLLWILAGVVFAGAVQDFIILFISTRRDGR